MGEKSGSFKIIGVCKSEEWPKIKKEKLLKSKLKQPKIYYSKDGKKEPLQDKFENLAPGATTPIYYLKFHDKVEDNFYIVFLEAPDQFIFREVKIGPEEEKSENDDLCENRSFNKIVNCVQASVVALGVIIPIVLNLYNKSTTPKITIEDKSYKYDPIMLFKKKRITPSKFKKVKIKIQTLKIYSKNINGLIDLDLKIPNKKSISMVTANKAELILKKNKSQYYLPNSMNYTVNANQTDVNARYLINVKLNKATKLKLKFILYDKSNVKGPQAFYIAFKK